MPEGEGRRAVPAEAGTSTAMGPLPEGGGKRVAPAQAGTTSAGGRFDPRRCVVLVPYFESIHPDCESALHELERRGYAVRRVGGYAQIDVARNQLASDALRDGFEETLWIDADIV